MNDNKINEQTQSNLTEKLSPPNYSEMKENPISRNENTMMDQCYRGNTVPANGPTVLQPSIYTDTTANIIFPQQTQIVQPVPYLKDNMTISIISAFCCLFIGIAAVVESYESKRARDLGNLEIAKRRASSAKKLAIAGIIVGTVLTLGAIAAIAVIIIKIRND